MNRRQMGRMFFPCVSLAGILLASPVLAGVLETVIYVNGKGDTGAAGPRLAPARASVHVRSVATWVNHSNREIRVTFPDEQKCEPFTRDALEWRAGKGGCFVTDTTVPPNGTMSAVFGGTGPHAYEVSYVGTDQTVRGTVVTFRGFGYPYGLSGF